MTRWTGYSTDPVPRDPATGKTTHDYLPARAVDGRWPHQTLRDTGDCLICDDPPDHPRHPPGPRTVAGSPESPVRDHPAAHGASR